MTEIETEKPKHKALGNVLRSFARRLRENHPDVDTGADYPDRADSGDAALLIMILANMVEGKSLYRSFGSPGDFGYGTPIGDALSALYKSGELPKGSF